MKWPKMLINARSRGCKFGKGHGVFLGVWVCLEK